MSLQTLTVHWNDLKVGDVVVEPASPGLPSAGAGYHFVVTREVPFELPRARKAVVLIRRKGGNIPMVFQDRFFDDENAARRWSLTGNTALYCDAEVLDFAENHGDLEVVFVPEEV